MVNPTCILLCAGKGTRMQNNRTHKVCYEIAGVPAILRLMENLKTAGISRFIVVVGDKCDKVMACLYGVEGVAYAYQAEQKGTGDATLCGLRSMRGMGLTGPVLVISGDKIIAPDVITEMIDHWEKNKLDAAFVIQPTAFNPFGGRIAIKDGRVYGIAEHLDVCMARLAMTHPKTVEELKKSAETLGLDSKRKEKLINRCLDRLDNLSPIIRVGGQDFTADEIESSGFCNTATYLFDSEKLTAALKEVGSDNAQGEMYLPDALNKIGETGRIEAIPILEKEKMLTYSTMDELLMLEQYFLPKRQDSAPVLHNASYWVNCIQSGQEELKKLFVEIYGDDPELLAERKEAYISLLESYIEKYGDQPVLIARAPGRVNLMGRHIEHRGGSINIFSINREMLLVASPREDDRVKISNVDPAFPDREFSILENIRQYDTSNWMDFIESDAITQMVLDHKGDWMNYIKAGVLRLQLENKHRILCGMNMMFHGNIPMAAGLSSSSSIVVATMEAAIGLNDMDLQPQTFINLCGEGEWFVGSRGGAGDHAAMKCGQKGMITHINFFPFSIEKPVKFPEGYRLVVANSYVQAQKSAGAKDQFNQKVASYEFGLMMIRRLFPEYKEQLRYLRDVNPETLGVKPSRIYEILLSLPERVTQDDLFKLLPEEDHAAIRQVLKNHRPPEFYDIRSVVLYGIAECERARKCVGLLESEDYATLGEMMNISHDGDRVWKDGKDFDYSIKDDALYTLIADLKSEEPEKVSAAQLWHQPGGYACSTPVIDELVDYIKTREGVLGTQLSGAGLGGCIMVFVRQDKAKALLDALKEHYYDPQGLPMGAEIFTPVAGSMSIK